MVLNIKNLSSFGNDKTVVLNHLRQLTNAYWQWLTDEQHKAEQQTEKEKKLGLQNVEKCKHIHQRMVQSIQLLEVNENAFRAFQLANTAIYLQMFQTEWHFKR